MIVLGEQYSDCCGVQMYDDSDICPECLEHCGSVGVLDTE